MRCDGLKNYMEEAISEFEQRISLVGYYFAAVWVGTLVAFTVTAKADMSDD